jgi:hypothetical protein
MARPTPQINKHAYNVARGHALRMTFSASFQPLNRHV